MAARPEISVAIPLYRELKNLPELRDRLDAVLKALELPYEVVLVDDGSDDGQWQLMTEYAQQEEFRAIRLARNFGLQAAATAALSATRGRAVILMDGDLQDPPELIPELVARWREGYQVVTTVKSSRPEGILKRLGFSFFYALFGWLAEVDLKRHSGLFSLMDRRAVDALLALPERRRYLPGLRAWTGFRQATVSFTRGSRYAGRPQGLRGLARMALDAIFSFSKLPLRAGIACGTLMGILALGAAGVIVALRLRDPDMQVGWASIMTTIVMVGAINLLFLGIVAEYLGRIYDEVQQRPLYIVSEETSAPPEDPS